MRLEFLPADRHDALVLRIDEDDFVPIDHGEILQAAQGDEYARVRAPQQERAGQVVKGRWQGLGLRWTGVSR